MKKKLTKALVTGVALSVVVPTIAQPVQAKDYIADGKNSLSFNRNKTEGFFNPKDKTRAEYYEKLGANKVYKTYRNYVYYYSPVRPRTVKSGLQNHSGLYENYKTRTALDEPNWNTRNLLVTTNRSSSLYNQNFKVKAKSLSSAKSGKNGGFVASVNKDKTGTFAGRYGEWRYLGYSDDGAATGNAFFPEDYSYKYNPSTYPYVTKPWTKSGVPKMFVPGSAYDGGTKGTGQYDTKARMVKKLLDQTPGFKAQSTSVAYWMDRLSLTSAPIEDTAVFRGVWNVAKNGRTPVYRYVEYTVINEKVKRNLMVTRMEIIEKDSGDVVAIYTNNTPGKSTGTVSYRGDKAMFTQTKYDVKITVKNLNNTATKLSQSELEAGFKKNYNPTTAYPDNFKGKNGNEFTQRLKAQKIPANGQVNFMLSNVVVPDDQANKMIMVNSLIGDAHRTGEDNLLSDDDAGVIPISVKEKPGDMGIEKIELIDEKGKVVPQPIPGERYRVRYTYKYEGGDIRYATYKRNVDKEGNVYYTFDGYVYPKVNLSVKSSIERKLPQGRSDVSQETISLTSRVYNGSEFKFETKEAVLYENPYVKATGDFDISDGYSRYNSGSDRHSKTWQRPYDYAVKDLQVVPRTERTSTPGKMKVAVSFTATQDAPTEATRVGFQEELDFAVDVKVGNKTYTKEITEHVREGENRNIVVEMDVDAKPTDVITAAVEANYTQDAWEWNSKGNVYDNNRAVTIGNLSNLTPTGGNYNDDNTFAYVSPYMLSPEDEEWVPNTSNEWMQTYEVRNFDGQRVTYKSQNGTNFSFTKYRRNLKVEDIERKQEESYEIEEVLFRSKFTKDNKMGEDGWVNMLATTEAPRIKAGYGYELKVKVRYKTNALDNQPAKKDIPNFNSRGSRTGEGTAVRPYNVAPNIPEEIFVKIPGMNKPLSVNGKQVSGKSTLAKMDVKRSGTAGDTVLEYTLKATQEMGITEPGKLYVGENVKDGFYPIQIWTPQINGIGTKNPTVENGKTVYESSLLADFREVEFEVKGSATDDLVDSIIQ